MKPGGSNRRNEASALLDRPLALQLLLSLGRTHRHAWHAGDEAALVLVEVGALTDDALHAQLRSTITRLMKLLTRRGVLV
jgi:hypothetical protein